MNRGNLAEDPRVGRPSSSRYSRQGAEENKLLYSYVRGKMKYASAPGTGKTDSAKRNHILDRTSVGRSLHTSGMDRLEVGSDGRLFGVHGSAAVQAPQTAAREFPNPVVTQAAKTVRANLPVSQSEPFLRTTKPNRPSLTEENPLLQRSTKQAARQAARAARRHAGISQKQVNPRGIGSAPAADSRSIGSAPAANPQGMRRTAVPNPLFAPAPSRANTDSFWRRHRRELMAAAGAFLLAGYAYTAVRFQNRFYPGTSFFGIEASGLSVTDVKDAIRDKVAEYTLTLHARNTSIDIDGTGAEKNVITAENVGMTYLDDGSVDRAMENQRSYLWPAMMIVNAVSGHEDELETQYDGALVDSALEALPCFDKENEVSPEDAQIVLDDDGAHVASEILGTTLDYDSTKTAVTHALDKGLTDIDLEKLGLYENPGLFSDDLGLNREAEKLDDVLGAHVKLDFGDRTEDIDSEKVRSFLSTDASGSYYIDEDKVRSYVTELAAKYDTVGNHTFYTSIGTTVQLDGGTYGCQMDQDSTYSELIDALENKRQTTLEPVYFQKGISRAENDLGGTYVEISITDQELWFYKDGSLVVKTPVVTGNPYKNNGTPSDGVWPLEGKYRNSILKGEGYASPVDYWMPFNGGVGIHDLQSRYYFGGTVYQGAGSHGCVNTPLAAVRLIYENIGAGIPVVVYTDESQAAMDAMTGMQDITTITAEIEADYGVAQDDGAGSIVQQEAAKKSAQNTSNGAAAASSSSAAGSASATGVWR